MARARACGVVPSYCPSRRLRLFGLVTASSSLRVRSHDCEPAS
ncbi:hypothetical protein ACFPRL_26100 [Pseudoclavibacter helvolus]